MRHKSARLINALVVDAFRTEQQGSKNLGICMATKDTVHVMCPPKTSKQRLRVLHVEDLLYWDRPCHNAVTSVAFKFTLPDLGLKHN